MTTPQLTKSVGSDDTIARVFGAVAEILLNQGRVEVDGFGTFELSRRKPRIARNPRTGARIDVPAKVVVKFKPTSALKRQAEQLPDVPGSS